MPINPNSLANLKPGNRKGVKHKVTKSFITKLTDYIEKDLPNFIDEIEQLPLKERVYTKTKLMEMIIPKKQEVSVGEAEKQIDWKIEFVEENKLTDAITDAEVEEIKK